MSFKEVKLEDLNENLVKMISKEWMLISAGNSTGFNMMTASWGFVGEMWGKDAVIAMIRPQRYTKEFVDTNEYFSLSFYGDNKSIHNICGHQSGRDVDKAKETGLTPVFSDNTVYFGQARVVFICKKTYVQKLEKDLFVDQKTPENFYKENDFHIAYYGIIEKVLIKE